MSGKQSGSELRENLKSAKRIVVKIGTSSLTYENGHINMGRIGKLARVLCDFLNQGKDVVLVSSGAIGVGADKLHLSGKPSHVSGRQAAAAVGQGALMHIYSQFFAEYGYQVGQVLLTKDVVEREESKENVINTFRELMSMHVVSIVNENDTVSVDEIRFGDNDYLSYIVASLIRADALIILTDIDGFYDRNPAESRDAVLYHNITDLSEKIEEAAGGAGSSLGTGGMLTKVHACRLAADLGVNAVIANGSNPEILYDILNGQDVGTLFVGRKETERE